MYKHKLIAVSIILGSALVPCISSAETAAQSTSSSTTAATPVPAKPQTAPTTPAPTTPAAPDKSANEMSKEKWLGTIVPMLPSLICKGFMNDTELKQRLDAIKMTYEQCVKVVPDSVTKCQNQISPNIPETITSADASTWGKALGECIGKDFAMKYLMPH